MTQTNTKNLKRPPIPVVPRTMQIVNADGTVTRSGQLLLEQLQQVGASEVTEVPSGTMNGINKDFTLSHTPTAGTLYLNGVEQVPGVDYTLDGATIVFTVPPKASDLIVAQYFD